MGFFTRTAMDMLMKTTHPEINRRQCWNLHPHRKPCTECKDICPYGEQIFTRPNLVKDWDPCTECGLCVSACRSGCIIPSPEQVQRDTSAADTDNDTIWIGCEKSTRKNSMVRACISALTWETLAYLALNKKIVLDLTPCGECENDLCAAQLRKELTRLVDFFGQPMFETRFTLAGNSGDGSQRGRYRSIGINRNDFLSLIQMRPDQPEDVSVIQWIAFASNAFNVMVPFYPGVSTTPEYLSNTGKDVSTDNFYWSSRLVAAMADASYTKSLFHIERYQLAVASKSHALIHQYDKALKDITDPAERQKIREEANQAVADMVKEETALVLDKVLYELSCQMKNSFSRSDA